MTTLHGLAIKVSDKVFDMRYGWSKVISLCKTSPHKIITNIGYCTTDGKYSTDHKFPSLFWNEFEIPKEAFAKPLPDLEVDTKVLVWDNGKTVKERHYFSHFDKHGNIYCFNNGVAGWIAKNVTTIRWDNWELYKDEN